MAQRVVTKFVSDISGEELGEDGQTVKFGFLGVDYEIDLSQDEADEFAADLDKYLNAGRRVGGGTKRRTAGKSPGSRSKAELDSIRAWAKDNGYKVSSRGRIAAEVVNAYDKAIA